MSNSKENAKTEIVYSEEHLYIKQKNEKRRQEDAKTRKELIQKLPSYSVVFKTQINYVKGDPKKDGLYETLDSMKKGEYDSDEEMEYSLFKALDAEQSNDKVYPSSTPNIEEASWYKVPLVSAPISQKVIDYVSLIERMNGIPKDQRDAKIILFPDFHPTPCKQCRNDRKCCNQYENVNLQLCKDCTVFFEKNACKHTQKDQFLTNPVLARVIRYMEVCNGYDPVTEIESLPIYPIQSKDIVSMFATSKLFTTEYKNYVENFDLGSDKLVYYQIVEDISKAALFFDIKGLQLLCALFCASYMHKEVLHNYPKMFTRKPRPRFIEDEEHEENNLLD